MAEFTTSPSDPSARVIGRGDAQDGRNGPLSATGNEPETDVDPLLGRYHNL
jgi:hypothetical protein